MGINSISTFVLLCNHHHPPRAELCHLPKLKLCPHLTKSLHPLPQLPHPVRPLAPTILFSVFMHSFLFSFLLGSQQMALCPYVPTRVKYYMGLSPVVGHPHLVHFMWAHAHDFTLLLGPMQLSHSHSALRKSLAN